MNSVMHLFQYSQLVPEIPRLPDPPDPGIPSGWPRYGIVTCEGVSVPSLGGGPAKGGNLLKNIWCCIRAQEKMGIIFSTESERRAFLAMLYRLTPFGGMVRLDGVDITSLEKDRLREKMTYISHSPTLLLGNVRESIDPDKTYTDAQVWRALEQVHLSTLVAALPHKLATDMVTVAEAMTTGQRQLLRLAGALLHQARVLIYEEPSSSVDLICSSIIHGVLRTLFPTSTVIHIAHLPDTIIHMDRIMILNEGRITEVDTPYYLLQNISSRLSAMVTELGSAQAEHLRQLALEKHENRPYVAPPMDPADLQELASAELRPGRLSVLPTFHSSRLAGVLNQLPTNKFSTDRL
ncbi:ABC transporter c family member 5 [Plakobranchus ocellatus]|uniref:ABC transporter c family member 5 n=1 Tax=Plakobranchus ocellatus TaxID=259542 RepID=A0AAV3YFW3_9GAST|nr:ABC transporter c family member 5 [Plakobranchus ocellatus]